MKKIIYLCTLFVFINIANSNAQNLVAYYKLDGNAYAFIGSENGTISGTTIADTNRFNLQNAAIRFVNSFSYASIPNSFDLPQKTINFWFRIDTITNNVNVLTIDNANLNHGMIYLQLYKSVSVNKLQFFGGSTTPLDLNISTKKWHKITITYSNSIYKLYINNILAGSVTSTNVHSGDGYSGLVLGSNRAFNSLSPFRGKIDDLSVYNYAMDSTQIANIADGSCDFNNIINVYDTTKVTIVDTNYVTVTDTNFVTITDTNYVSVHDTLIVDIFSSISQNPINTIKVYPNPTKDFLNINNGNFATINNYQYVIVNSNGATLFTQSVNAAQTTIDINNWPEGIYFLNIYDNSGKLIEVKKIILN